MAVREATSLSVTQLKARLRDHPCGAFAFYGPEELLKKFYLQKFEGLIRKEGAEEFNTVKLDFTRDHTLDHLLEEAEILPFMGEHRLITVRGAKLSQWTEGDYRRILPLLENFPPYLSLIFYMEHEEFPSDRATLGKSIVKKLGQKMDFVSFPLQNEKVLLPWSQKILAADGIRAEDGVLRLLFRLAGNRMNLIRNQLDQLCHYAMWQNRSSLTEEDVLLFAQDTAEFAVYQLCDAVLSGSLASVQTIFSSLQKQDIHPIVVSGALVRGLTATMLCWEGADATVCQKSAGIFPWQYDRYKQLARGKEESFFRQSIALCAELDRKLKSGCSDPYLVTAITLYEITSRCGRKS